MDKDQLEGRLENLVMLECSEYSFINENSIQKYQEQHKKSARICKKGLPRPQHIPIFPRKDAPIGGISGRIFHLWIPGGHFR